MLSIWESIAKRGRPLSRRALLQIGSLGFGSLALADYLSLRAAASETLSPEIPASLDDAALRRPRSVIHFFMGGGPSHIDMFDLKPDAPAEIRGEFRPISTDLPGVQICEHLPHLSSSLKRIALMRSVTHGNASHLPASHWMVTGYDPPQSTTSNVNPYCGAVVARLRGANVPGLPAYVSIPRRQLLGGPSYLGSEFNPFTTESDPATDEYAVKNLDFPTGLHAERINDRRGLLAQFDRMKREVDRRGEFAAIDRFTGEAIDIITGSRAQQAFDLKQEDAATRDRYGRTPPGQRCLLARRLVEAGVTFVTVLSGGEWDTHTDNFNILKTKSLPPMDQALAALVADLHERGLDEQVMVVASGEFGRTPTINKLAGRDHWPGAISALFAGGGLKVGQVIGATDAHAARPITHPYSPGDVLATVYRYLGVDPDHLFHDQAGRPMPVLPAGKPIAELIG